LHNSHKSIDKQSLQAANLNELLLDSLPHPTMLIRRKDKVIIAANKMAQEMGIKIGGQCWREFGKDEFISEKNSRIITENQDTSPLDAEITCSFCLADKCISESAQQKITVEALGRIWDIFWIKVNEDIFLHYGIDITEYKRVEKEKEELANALKERIKELNCLYSISSIIEMPDISLIEKLKRITNLLPSAWQYSDISCAKINIGNDEYRSDNCREAAWKQAADIRIHGVKAGGIEVCYLEKRSAIDEGPFLQQERSLINAVAERLSRFMERMKAEDALKQSEARYRELSIIDNLTQLYNSRHFYNQLQMEIDRTNRYEEPLTLILLDVDNFKTFNDTHGHIQGDDVLMRLGQVIKRCLRKTDSAYRYGGEEFIILLPVTKCEDGVITAERIRAEFKKENFSPVSGGDVRMSLSIGVSQHRPKEEMKAFVHRVDQLMYRVKKNGKDGVYSEP